MKKSGILLVLLLLAGIILSGYSVKTIRGLEQELSALRAELEQAKTSLAEKDQSMLEINNRQESAKEYTQLYNQTLESTENAQGIAPDQSYLFNLANNLDATYSTEEVLSRLNQIKDYLRSFSQLTEKSRKYVPKDEFEKIENTSWEVQTLGFANIPLTIEGALRDQNFIIKKLDLGFAIKKYELGEIGHSDLKEKADAYKKIKNEYEEFLKTAYYAD